MKGNDAGSGRDGGIHVARVHGMVAWHRIQLN